MPYPGCFAGGNPGLSKRKCQQLAMRRLLHVSVLVVNFPYLGRSATLEGIGRRPNQLQKRCLERLMRRVLIVCGICQDDIPMVPGRSGLELGAVLFRLEKFAVAFPEAVPGYGTIDSPAFRFGKDLFDVEEYPELMLYRSLRADRLRLVGSGAWDLGSFLTGQFWLPYLEPRFLLHGESIEDADFPSFDHESRSESLELARLWSTRGLFRFSKRPLVPGHLSRIFNCYRSAEQDRLIGDRRIPNARERRIDGSSRGLPGGFLLTNLRVAPYVEELRGSVTDRVDFYHQAAITVERTQSNIFPFSYSRGELDGFDEGCFAEEGARKDRRKNRALLGDGLGVVDEIDSNQGDVGFLSFASLPQGDHLGAGFALSAHEGLLQQGGLLQDDRGLLGYCPLPLTGVWEGLIIYDYFNISREKFDQHPALSSSFLSLRRAREIYDGRAVNGSIEKDIEASLKFKAAGDEVDSSASATGCGYVPVGASFCKRIALAVLSFRSARLRALFSKFLTRLFSLGACADDSEESRLIPLEVGVARELVFLGVLAPFMATNVAVCQSPDVFATDASLGLGGITPTTVPEEIAEAIWLGGDKKGGYAYLGDPPRAGPASAGFAVYEDYGEKELCDGHYRAPLLHFDFVGFYGGVGVISFCAAELGLVVVPPLDLSHLRHYTVTDMRMLEWCFYRVQCVRFKSLMCESPCTTFSPVAHPACRGYAERSRMAWLDFWRSLEERGCQLCILASCQFSSPHEKELVFLLYWVDAASLETRCPGGYEHLRIEGKGKKPLAVFVRDFAMHVAKGSYKAIFQAGAIEEDEKPTSGLESVLVNDVLLSSCWTVFRSWYWKGRAHINELEVSTAVSLLKQCATSRSFQRFSPLVDSSVEKGALAKGRSTSRCLQSWPRRPAILQLTADLCPSWSFAPTRLIVADDLTRRVPLRPAALHSFQETLSTHQLHHLNGGLLPRWVDGWVRLLLLAARLQLCGAEVLGGSDWTFSLSPTSWSLFLGVPTLGLPSGCFLAACFSRLGLTFGFLLDLLLITATILLYPFLLGFSLSRALSVSLCRSCLSWGGVVSCVLVFAMVSGAAPLEPTSKAERDRAVLRAGNDLIASRVVKPETRQSLDKLLASFQIWLWENQEVSLLAMLSREPVDAEELSFWLIEYGKQMFSSGAWDLAFVCFADEPHQHHPALPLSVMMAMVSLSLMWRWAYEVGVIVLAWSGIPRIEEVLFAKRGDLVLPRDAMPGVAFVLLKISLPKTRGGSAKHQAASFDPPELVSLLSAIYGGLDRGASLWPLPAATLRKRFSCLLGAIGLPSRKVGSSRPFDLGSLRPGGVTHLWLQTEDSGVVRRRGRWLSHRVNEIYLQEVLVTTFAETLSPAVRQRIFSLAGHFDMVLQKAIFFLSSAVSKTAWVVLFQASDAR